MLSIKGLAIGIGSMPQKDADEALDLIFKYIRHIPFWPQLPKRDLREGMIMQFTENLPALKVTKAGVFFDNVNKDAELEKFYERIIAEDEDYFKISKDFAVGLYKFYARLEASDLKEVKFIKCQVTGPFSFASSIKGENGIAILHDKVWMQAIVKGLAMKALWQIKFFEKFGKPIILFFDEPYLSCFGSAYAAIDKNEVIRVLADLTASVKKSENILVGIHCCGNTDWSIFTQVDGIDIISFDAFSFLDKLALYSDQLKSFFKRQGKLCWGIVPTEEFTPSLNAGFLVQRIKAGIDILSKKGLDRELLLDNLCISPSCGLGALTIEKSQDILGLLQETENKLFDNLT